MGVRSRLILFIVGVTTIVMLAWGVTVVNGEAIMLRDDAQQRGLEVLKTIAVPCALALRRDAPEELEPILLALHENLAEGGLSRVDVVDVDGKVIAQSDADAVPTGEPFTVKALASSEPLVEETRDQRGRRLHLSMPLYSGVRLGTAIAEVDLAYLDKRIDTMSQRIVLGSALMSAFGALCLSVLMSTSVMRPLEQLSRTALRVSRGDLTARVPDSGGNDELVVLARVFNDMVAAIHGHTSQLEKEVLHRTEELSKTNDALARANKDLAGAVQQLELLAATDGLTGLVNHRSFQETLSFELRRARRNESPLSVLMIDVDHFKAYNDANGHPAGDQVLVQLARILRESLRNTDVVARYGGEEFTVILPDTPAEPAKAVAQKLREAVRSYPFPGAEQSQPEGRVTISVGVATAPADGDSASGIVSAADRALYVAKGLGRDQVAVPRARA
jgi:diguanylate cyclase (GGDEF)-like protein